jgi:hypothetical protein
MAIQPYYTTHKKATGEVLRPEVSFDEFAEKLPDTVNGEVSSNGKNIVVEDIPVLNPEKQTLEQTAYFNQTYDPLPGGCECEILSDTGTLCTKAYNYNKGAYCQTTAGHLAHDSGYNMYQPASTSYVDGVTGKTVEGATKDYAIVNHSSTSSYEYAIAGDAEWGYEEYPVIGVHGADAIEDMYYTGEYIQNQGRTTGRHFSQITELEYDEANTLYRMAIGYKCDYGDSGGPYFNETDSGDAKIIGLHAWIGSDNSLGNTINYIEDNLNITV